MKKSLLIELGVEELPAIPLLKSLDSIKKSWESILKSFALEGDFELLYTPRRLVIKSFNIPSKQSDREEELFGPPIEIAIKDNEPTKAGVGFAKKCGVDFNKLERVKKGSREFLYYKKSVKGLETKELLPDMVKSWVESMNFGKMMRWGECKREFIRPIRWLQVRLDSEIVPMELFKVNSSDITYPHRLLSFEPIKIDNIDEFEDKLKESKVILNQNKRASIIEDDFKKIEEDNSLEIEKDKSLFSEVVAITEYPKALLGSFDEKFLELPPEVIITSMKEHQRYFPVFRDERLMNHFVVVSNAICDDYTKVIKGNERVLRPRLEDALFFYRNDLKRGLSIEGLEKIQFLDGLGSLKDKVDRERDIALRLAGIYMDKLEATTNKSPLDIEYLIDRAITLAKADLLTEMVYEFTELQGIMGYYYAKALGEDELVYTAIKEQYLPSGEGDSLPSSIFSSVIALAIKLDTLIGLFSIGKIPTGSKDPFALRRAVNGIIKIVTNYDLSFDILKILELLRDLYKPFDEKALEEFILERIKKAIRANPSIINAVLATNERDINEIYKKVLALNEILSQENSKELFATFKRVANISSGVDIAKELIVDETLFSQDEERELWNNFLEVKGRDYKSYLDKLQALFNLRGNLERFFDSVLVDSEDEKLRVNRHNLIASIYKEFLNIADLKEISI